MLGKGMDPILTVGTPDTTGNVSEVHPSIRTCWVRHCKNDLIHRAVSG